MELKPCPFCGGEAEICSAFENKFLGKYWYVRCKTCYSKGTGMYESTKELEPNEEYKAIIGAWERAIEAWNRRVSDGNSIMDYSYMRVDQSGSEHGADHDD